MTDTNPDVTSAPPLSVDPEYAQFLAWKASQLATPETPEPPAPVVQDLLDRLHLEPTANVLHTITDWVGHWFGHTSPQEQPTPEPPADQPVT